ncbi:hypothetical protein [Nitrosococcus oceani]|uniref:hypothetical protein n=1 Tax=Nitrosococcus oceani TaxID=1229 RepID=UPI00030E05BE|nr:hypothetical protein [Nitrosococcus oceani]GEM21335.1 hypothetical protein NONS58_27740 [Nitrosococcus oceani]
MSRRLELEITERVEELKALLHQQSKVKGKERVQAYICSRASKSPNSNSLGKVLGRNPSTLPLSLV